MMEYVRQLEFPENDPFITNLLSELGTAILDTAYLAFGSEVEQAILVSREKLAEEVPDEEKVVFLVNSLNGLLEVAMDNKREDNEKPDIFEDEDGRTINHILKLSPFCIKNIEAKNLKPTCLSMSMIIASFFKQCGVDDQFHVGVVTPKDWPYAVYTQTMAEAIDDFASTHPVPYSDKLQQMLRKRAKSSSKISEDWDPHSAVIFRIGEAYVLQDPYQRTSIYLRKERSKEHLGTIAALQEANPAIEVLYNPDEDLSHVEWPETLFDSYNYLLREGTFPSLPTCEKTLEYAVLSNDISPIMDLLDGILPQDFDDFSRFLVPSGLVGNRLLTYDFGDVTDGDLLPKIREFAYVECREFIVGSIATQIFWLKDYDEAKIRQCLERCSRDEQYFARRAEDMILWPHRLMLGAIQAAWQDIGGNNSPAPHVSLEVGNIEHRIGASALLDVSYGLEMELPISFWARQTSSQLPWLYSEQAARYELESPTGKEVSDNLKRILEVLNWRYRQIVGII